MPHESHHILEGDFLPQIPTYLKTTFFSGVPFSAKTAKGHSSIWQRRVVGHLEALWNHLTFSTTYLYTFDKSLKIILNNPTKIAPYNQLDKIHLKINSI